MYTFQIPLRLVDHYKDRVVNSLGTNEAIIEVFTTNYYTSMDYAICSFDTTDILYKFIEFFYGKKNLIMYDVGSEALVEFIMSAEYPIFRVYNDDDETTCFLVSITDQDRFLHEKIISEGGKRS